MKNEHITPGQLVPEEIRLEVYKQALRLIREDEGIPYRLDDWLICLLLPCILWDLEYFLDRAPNGKCWSSIHTTKMFPEMEGISYAVKGYYSTERSQIRIEFLERAIEKLESK